jgi:hypothetical protein
MALYKYSQYLGQSQHEAFDAIYSPGHRITDSGIYRCEGCGDEIAANKGDPLPPQNHHQHSTVQGSIRWKMIVFSQSKR